LQIFDDGIRRKDAGWQRLSAPASVKGRIPVRPRIRCGKVVPPL